MAPGACAELRRAADLDTTPSSARHARLAPVADPCRRFSQFLRRAQDFDPATTTAKWPLAECPANAIVADLGGTTKPAGVYCTASSIGVTGTLTLDGGGDPNATFVFQAGTSLITAGNIVLIGGAQANNVYWQVGTSATLGTASQWQGNILVLTSITLVDNATLLGRALARNGSVSLGTNNVINLP